MKNFKNKSKKFTAVFMALVASVASNKGICLAEKSTDGEIAFCMRVLESLPKRGEPGFDDTLRLPSEEELQEKLNEKRVEKIHHRNGTEEELTIDEKQVYDEIKRQVNELMAEVARENPGLNEEDFRTYTAEKIYHWVSQNIVYDPEEARSQRGTFGERISRIKSDVLSRGIQDPNAIKAGIADVLSDFPELCSDGVDFVKQVNSIYNRICISIVKDKKKGQKMQSPQMQSPQMQEEKKEILCRKP